MCRLSSARNMFRCRRRQKMLKWLKSGKTQKAQNEKEEEREREKICLLMLQPLQNILVSFVFFYKAIFYHRDFCLAVIFFTFFRRCFLCDKHCSVNILGQPKHKYFPLSFSSLSSDFRVMVMVKKVLCILCSAFSRWHMWRSIKISLVI